MISEEKFIDIRISCYFISFIAQLFKFLNSVLWEGILFVKKLSLFLHPGEKYIDQDNAKRVFTT